MKNLKLKDVKSFKENIINSLDGAADVYGIDYAFKVAKEWFINHSKETNYNKYDGVNMGIIASGDEIIWEK